MNPDERETIQRALRGDDEAFEAVIRETSRKIYAVAFGILQDAAEAEDVTQETFLKAHRHRWRLRDPEKFPAWLFAVARHRSLDTLRRRRSRPLHAPHQDEETRPDDAAQSPDSSLEDAERHDDIHRALASLPEHHRTALTLRYLEGVDPSSIEQTMGITNGALRGILGRALAAMRKSLHPSPSNSR